MHFSCTVRQRLCLSSDRPWDDGKYLNDNDGAPPRFSKRADGPNCAAESHLFPASTLEFVVKGTTASTGAPPLNASFSLLRRTTRATGRAVRESAPARSGTTKVLTRFPGRGGPAEPPNYASPRSWPVIRRNSDSTMRAALIYGVGMIAALYLFYLFLH